MGPSREILKFCSLFFTFHVIKLSSIAHGTWTKTSWMLLLTGNQVAPGTKNLSLTVSEKFHRLQLGEMALNHRQQSINPSFTIFVPCINNQWASVYHRTYVKNYNSVYRLLHGSWGSDRHRNINFHGTNMAPFVCLLVGAQRRPRMKTPLYVLSGSSLTRTSWWFFS